MKRRRWEFLSRHHSQASSVYVVAPSLDPCSTLAKICFRLALIDEPAFRPMIRSCLDEVSKARDLGGGLLMLRLHAIDICAGGNMYIL